MQGLAVQTEKLFEGLLQLDCIKPYTLIGGTALALQIGNRLSEDLDFCRWSVNLKTRDTLNFLSNSKNYIKRKEFSLLNPRYLIDGKDIEDFIKSGIISEYGLSAQKSG